VEASDSHKWNAAVEALSEYLPVEEETFVEELPPAILEEEEYETEEPPDTQLQQLLAAEDAKSKAQLKADLRAAVVAEDKASLAVVKEEHTMTSLKGDMAVAAMSAKLDKSDTNIAAAKAAEQAVTKEATILQKVHTEEASAKAAVERASAAVTGNPPSAVPPAQVGTAAAGSTAMAAPQDPVDANYVAEKDHFKGLLSKDEAAVTEEESKLQSLEKSNAELSQKLEETRQELDTTQVVLKRAKEKQAYDHEQHTLYASKEAHHKKVTLVRQRIEANRERVTLHAQELARGKERLHKALEEKAELEAVIEKHAMHKKQETPHVEQASASASASSKPSSGLQDRNDGVQDPHLEAAVEAVQTSLNAEALEAELKPKIEALKMRYAGQPKQLQRAIQALVSHMVGQSVNAVIAKNHHVSNALHRATQSVTEKRNAAEKAATEEVKALKTKAVRTGVQAASKHTAGSGLGFAKSAAKHVMKKSNAAMEDVAKKEEPTPTAPAKVKAPSADKKKESSSWLGTIEDALDPFD